MCTTCGISARELALELMAVDFRLFQTNRDEWVRLTKAALAKYRQPEPEECDVQVSRRPAHRPDGEVG